MTKEQANTLAGMIQEKHPDWKPEALEFANPEHGYFVGFILDQAHWLLDNFDDGVRYLEEHS